MACLLSFVACLSTCRRARKNVSGEEARRYDYMIQQLLTHVVFMFSTLQAHRSDRVGVLLC